MIGRGIGSIARGLLRGAGRVRRRLLSPLCSMPGPSAASIARSTALRDTAGSPVDDAAFPLALALALTFSMALSFRVVDGTA